MATEAQINANRKNALKSTGPRTQEGKETVSQNATKHGLCSCKNVIRSESQDEYNLFHDEMIEDLSPAGAMEYMLAERIVSLSWRLKRAEVYQNSVMDSIIDDRINEKWDETRNAREQAKEGDMSLIIGLAIRRDFADCRTLDLLLMYERRIENSLYKATAELRKIQKLRRERQTTDDGRPATTTAFLLCEAALRCEERDAVTRETIDEGNSVEQSQFEKEYRIKETENRINEKQSQSEEEDSPFSEVNLRRMKIQNAENDKKPAKQSQLSEHWPEYISG